MCVCVVTVVCSLVECAGDPGAVRGSGGVAAPARRVALRVARALGACGRAARRVELVTFTACLKLAALHSVLSKLRTHRGCVDMMTRLES